MKGRLEQEMRDYLSRGWHIWSAKQLRDYLRDSRGLDYKLWYVRRVLRDDFNMRYRVLKKVEYQGNSERCLVLRMLYAKMLLLLLEQGKRILNIDQSWLPSLDFRGKKWRARGEQNTLSNRPLGHRVNIIAALVTDGRLYLSLT